MSKRQECSSGSFMVTLAHIVNPVIVGESSDLLIAQPITFETMRIARAFAQGHVEVTLLTAQYPEDRPLVPEGFRMTPDLVRSVLDVGTFRKQRKLPLLKDILDRLYEGTDAEYLLYSNVDIALQPHFYIAVKHLIDHGYDAFVINRRTISHRYWQIDEIPLMYAQVGKPHPGLDCFVFRRDVYPSYCLGSACIGAGLSGKVLLVNQMSHATQFGLFSGLHLTFHLGDDRAWRSSSLQDYFQHNRRELRKVLEHYKSVESFWTKYREEERHLFQHPRLRYLVAEMKYGRLRASSVAVNFYLARELERLLGRFGLAMRKRDNG
jgi:hypothetical protein